MRQLLLASAALFALTTAGQADIINVGVNPTSATGHFSNDVGGGAFTDFITFQLVGAPQFLTFASATNDFGAATDFITNFTGQLFEQVGAPGGGDDIAFGPVNFAAPCPTLPGACQILAGSATLDAGNYYLQLAGIGGGTSGYGGDITTRAVPGPLAGAGIPGLVLAIGGLVGLARRRKQAT
jgi:hypothetical protein